MDRVSRTRTSVVITKRGRPVVSVVPYAEPSDEIETLVGSMLEGSGDAYRTGEPWDADLS